MSFREVKYGTAASESPLQCSNSGSDVFCAGFYVDVFRYFCIKGDTSDTIFSPRVFALYCGRSSTDSSKNEYSSNSRSSYGSMLCKSRETYPFQAFCKPTTIRFIPARQQSSGYPSDYGTLEESNDDERAWSG
ncbi:uncharacterized protein LOC124276941 [Haliotis rubra]|uniref:uncharacterized protein LOC124276941 n=1 Tax=Haliotis rubra TaxID=36100 RepID=UPI001EE5FC58|nr:uncharacterized protein LOC124276941 [Haliotis rubra]